MTYDEAIEQLDQVSPSIDGSGQMRRFTESRVQAAGHDFDQLATWVEASGGHVEIEERPAPRLPGDMVQRAGNTFRVLAVPESLFSDRA